ncbi:Aluminum-activated malate transporter [Artemisia annua]|uniref:Aluminum-activated malate transporter n=1 Tax=Artemisia annua TaxID=35608 RepID=A0A2U1MJH7_ARTAN|nr:Aluminum-activated malate transporter [Artemisia annua]
MAHQRFSTIIIGGATSIIVSMCVCPVWAGEDLHKLTVLNMEKLASFLEGHGNFLFRHPWKQYLKIGVYTRQRAHHMEALHEYLDPRLEVPSEFSKVIPRTMDENELGSRKRLERISLSLSIERNCVSFYFSHSYKKLQRRDRGIQYHITSFEWSISD